ncbi:MAG: T9SS type A sorting domain-containing protein [Bacteroidota bacterium]|nr:T9SS type A sorting domain-containing protein [Bacteroidota bacterium]
MKTLVLSITAIFTLVTTKAQFTENFDAATINSLTANCWVLNGVSTTTQGNEAINVKSIYTAPPTNPGTKIDLYTPVLDITSTSTTIKFDYRLTQLLNANATRSIQVGLVNLFGILVISNSITMDASTNTSVKQYEHTLNSITAGKYRVVLRITGAQGSGNVRLVLDNFEVTNATLSNIGSGGCTLVPITETALPVKLINFDASYNKPNVTLNWSTAQENNFSHFILEQSTDGSNFNQVALIFGAGESDSKKDYSYIDRNLTGRKGLIYYRLKSVDIDSKLSYSSIRIIRLDNELQNIVITTFPNPAINELKITIPASWQGKKATYEVVNVNGQVSKKVETGSSSQTETLNVSNLNSGLYIVKVTCEGKTAQQKIIKQ